MGHPNWNRITENGRPFDYVDPSVQPLVDEIESLKRENELLKIHISNSEKAPEKAPEFPPSKRPGRPKLS